MANPPNGPAFGVSNSLYSVGDYRTNALNNVAWEQNPPTEPWIREDGTKKGTGWLGMLKRPDGSVSSEISAGMQIHGKQMDVPLIVPTLSPDEVHWLLNTQPDAPDYFHKMPHSILQKAQQHATQRIALGLSPFAD